jgi:hypothetical protein
MAYESIYSRIASLKYHSTHLQPRKSKRKGARTGTDEINELHEFYFLLVGQRVF